MDTILPFEILQSILKYLDFDFISKIRLRQTCKRLYKLQIHDFENVPQVIICRLRNDILLQHKHIKYLSLHNNKHVTDINCLKNLQTIIVYGSIIGDKEIYFCGAKIIKPHYLTNTLSDFNNAYERLIQN
jgi:hypothetical protein